MNLKEIMNELTLDYCSEKDFQINLAMKLIDKKYTVVCEYPFESKVEYNYYKEKPQKFEQDKDKKNAYIDIVCSNSNELIPIELKYRTKSQKISKNGIKFNLADQSAHDDGCYGFLRDICRIKEFIENNENCNEGYAVFLTNDDKYQKTYKGMAYSEFWFGEKGPEVKQEGNVGKVNGKYRKLKLPSSEEYEWEQWNSKNGFSFLVIKIKNTQK